MELHSDFNSSEEGAVEECDTNSTTPSSSIDFKDLNDCDTDSSENLDLEQTCKKIETVCKISQPIPKLMKEPKKCDDIPDLRKEDLVKSDCPELTKEMVSDVVTNFVKQTEKCALMPKCKTCGDEEERDCPLYKKVLEEYDCPIRKKEKGHCQLYMKKKEKEFASPIVEKKEPKVFSCSLYGKKKTECAAPRKEKITAYSLHRTEEFVYPMPGKEECSYPRYRFEDPKTEFSMHGFQPEAGYPMHRFEQPKSECSIHGFQPEIRFLMHEFEKEALLPMHKFDEEISKGEAMTTEQRDFVNQSIRSDKIVIFSKEGCPFCKMAKDAFNKLGAKFTTIALDQRDDTQEIQEVLREMTGVSTVPQVFVNEKYIGGGMDTKKKYANGELAKLVDA